MPVRQSSRLSMNPKASIIAIAMVAIALTMPGRLLSDPQPKKTELDSSLEASNPVLVVVMMSNNPVFRTKEKQLATQLELAMDDFTVKRFIPETPHSKTPAPSDKPLFAMLSLSEKLRRIHPFASKVDAAAVIWLEDGGDGAAFLYVASQSTDRAFVRIVRGKGGPHMEEALACAARELLGQVYMLSKPPGQTPIEETVELIMNKARSLRQPNSKWGVLPFFKIGGGVYGHKGSTFKIGGGVATEFIFGKLFFLRLLAAASAGPFMAPRDGVVSGWSIEPGLNLGFSWDVQKRLKLGFFAGAASVYSAAYMSLGNGSHQAYNWWNFHGSCGADLRLSLNDRVSFVIDPTLELWTAQKSFYRVSDNSVVIKTPLIGWHVLVGLLIYIK